MDRPRFYVFFNSISVISEQCAVKPRLQLKTSPSQVGLVFGTARSAGQRLTHCAIGDPDR